MAVTSEPARNDDAQSITLNRAQRTLALIWFPMAGLVLLLFIAMSFGAFTGEGTVRTVVHADNSRTTSTLVEDAWNWVLPALLPTLSLMIGVLGASALGEQPSVSPNVNKTFYRLAVGLSVFYLLLVLLTPLTFPGHDPWAIMKMSNLWLAPVQGLTASALGALFISKKSPAEKQLNAN